MSNQVKVTLIRGYSGRTESQIRTLKSLGLKRIGSSKVLPRVNQVIGQINKVIQFVKVEEVN